MDKPKGKCGLCGQEFWNGHACSTIKDYKCCELSGTPHDHIGMSQFSIPATPPPAQEELRKLANYVDTVHGPNGVNAWAAKHLHATPPPAQEEGTNTIYDLLHPFFGEKGKDGLDLQGQQIKHHIEAMLASATSRAKQEERAECLRKVRHLIVKVAKEAPHAEGALACQRLLLELAELSTIDDQTYEKAE